MAFILYGILMLAPAFGQQRLNKLTIIPDVATGDQGAVYFAEKRQNGTSVVGLRGPVNGLLSFDLFLPSNVTYGPLCSDSAGQLSLDLPCLFRDVVPAGPSFFQSGSATNPWLATHTEDLYLHEPSFPLARVKISAGASTASYTLTLPTAAPTGIAYLATDASGNLSFSPGTGTCPNCMTTDTAQSILAAASKTFQGGIGFVNPSNTGLLRFSSDYNGFTMYNTFGVPTIIGFSASGTLVAQTIGVNSLTATTINGPTTMSGDFTFQAGTDVDTIAMPINVRNGSGGTKVTIAPGNAASGSITVSSDSGVLRSSISNVGIEFHNSSGTEQWFFGTNTARVNGLTGYTGNCATTLVVTNGLVTGCI